MWRPPCAWPMCRRRGDHHAGAGYRYPLRTLGESSGRWRRSARWFGGAPGHGAGTGDHGSRRPRGGGGRFRLRAGPGCGDGGGRLRRAGIGGPLQRPGVGGDPGLQGGAGSKPSGWRGRVEASLEQLREEFAGVADDGLQSVPASSRSPSATWCRRWSSAGSPWPFLVLFLFLRDSRYPEAIPLATPHLGGGDLRPDGGLRGLPQPS